LDVITILVGMTTLHPDGSGGNKKSFKLNSWRWPWCETWNKTFHEADNLFGSRMLFIHNCNPRSLQQTNLL